MIPEEINKQIEKAFSAEMQGEYCLVYTHYDDSFDHSAKTIQTCMEKEDSSLLLETLDDWIVESQNNMCDEIIDELKNEVLADGKYAGIHSCLEEWLDDDSNRGYLRQCITEILGENEDFDGLTASLEDYSMMSCCQSVNYMTN